MRTTPSAVSVARIRGSAEMIRRIGRPDPVPNSSHHFIRLAGLFGHKRKLTRSLNAVARSALGFKKLLAASQILRCKIRRLWGLRRRRLRLNGK